MSIITLKSNQVDGSDNILDEIAVNFNNRFLEGIQLGPDSTLELISANIVKYPTYNVIKGINDRFINRFGLSSQGFRQKLIILRPNRYTGDELAAEIARACNDAMIMCSFRSRNITGVVEGWSCVYQEAVEPYTFTLTNNQVDDTLNPIVNNLQVSLIDSVKYLTQDDDGNNTGYYTNLWDSTLNQGGPASTDDSSFFYNKTEFPLIDNKRRVGNPNILNPDMISNGIMSKRGMYDNSGMFEMKINVNKKLADLTEFNNLATSGTTPTQLTLNNYRPNENHLINKIEFTENVAEVAEYAEYYPYLITVQDPLAEDILKPPNVALTGIQLLNSGAVMTALTTTGIGYTPGDLLSSNGAGGAGSCVFEVLTVDLTGAITDMVMNQSGFGFSDGATLALVGGSGSNAEILDAQLVGPSSLSGVYGTGTDFPIFDKDELTTALGFGKIQILTRTPFTFQAETLSITEATITDFKDAGYSSGDIIAYGDIPGKLNYAVLTFGKENVFLVSVMPSGLLGFVDADHTGKLRTDNLAYEPERYDFCLMLNTYDALTEKTIHEVGINKNNDDFLLQSTKEFPKSLTNSDVAVPLHFTPELEDFYYPVRCGYARNNIATSDIRNGRITSLDDGMDWVLTMETVFNQTSGNDEINFSLTQLENKAGPSTYPNGAWRKTRTIFTRLNPETFVSPELGPVNNPWTTYTFGDDINIKFELEKFQITLTITHGLNDEPIVFTSGDNFTGFLGRKILTNTDESFYPLRPVIWSSPGYGFQEDRSLPAVGYALNGVLDFTTITQPLQGSNGAIISSKDSEFTPAFGLGAKYSLPAMFKFGLVPRKMVDEGRTQSQIINNPVIGGGMISSQDFNPNIANIWRLLGFPLFVSTSVGATTHEYATLEGVSPATSYKIPSIVLELPDFNIKSYSGDSSDSGRALAVIPSDEWNQQVDNRSDTVFYSSKYSQPIKLNLPSERTFYEIAVRLRLTNGLLARGFSKLTSLCLRLDTTEESKQRKALQNMVQLMGNIQDRKITNNNFDNNIK